VIKLFLAGVLLVAAGCSQAGGAGSPASAAPAAATGAPSPASASGSSAPAGGVAVHVKDFAIDPGTVKVEPGAVTFSVTNDGPTVHNVTVRDSAGAIVFGSADLREGESATISGDLKAGTYDLICTLPGHESLGTKAKLEVAGP